MLDKHTFSDSLAAERLIDKLNQPEYAQYRPRVDRLLSLWFEYSSAVMDIRNEKVRLGTLQLWRAHYLEWAKGCNVAPELKTFLTNVIVTQYRKCAHETRKRDKTEG